MKNLKQLLFTLFIVANLSACTLIMWGENPAFSEYTTSETIFTDDIFALAQVKQQQGNVPANSTLIIGNKHIYSLLPTGGQQLLTTYQTIPNRHNLILSIGDDEALEFEVNEDGSFSGRVPFRYQKETPITDSEWAVLESLAFERHDDKLAHLTISVTGNIHTHAEGNQQLLQSNNFRQRYPVELVKTTTHRKVDGERLIANIAATPFTLAGDIIILLPMALTVGAVGSISNL